MFMFNTSNRLLQTLSKTRASLNYPMLNYSKKSNGGPTLETLRDQLASLNSERDKVRDAIKNYVPEGKRKILMLGAGLSSTQAIRYLLSQAGENNWFLKVGDSNLSNARAKVGDSPHGVAFKFDYSPDNEEALSKEVESADMVISLLPMALHPEVAKHCLAHNKHLVTASYTSPAMAEFHTRAQEKDLLFLNEVGLDPGLDHMISMKTINAIRAKQGDLKAFESFTGGLVAPESDDNPWGYKFSWNPRNVVLAGQGGCKFIQQGRYKYIPYHKTFQRSELLQVEGVGTLEGYANRDSLKYRKLYGLESVPTMYRGTLRQPGFCEAWDIFVQLGMTDDTIVIEDSQHMTYREFINSFLFYSPNDSVELKLAYLMKMSIDSPVFSKLRWLGIFDDRLIGLERATPAQILQKLLQKKWVLRPTDKDMIVMFNKFVYETSNGDEKEVHSSCVVKGDGNPDSTAMAKTVGLPLGVAVKLLLQGDLPTRGVAIPTIPEIYEPILSELEKFGIVFESKVVSSTSGVVQHYH